MLTVLKLDLSAYLFTVRFSGELTGGAYGGFVVGWGGENMAVQLLDTLEFGKTYTVRAFASLSNLSGCGIDRIQFAFTTNKVTAYDTINWSHTYLTDSIIALASNQIGNIIMDTIGWVLITDTFIANGGELYMTVGSFDTTQTQYQINDSSSQYNYSYYYFDDFDVHCIDCSTSVQPIPDPADFSISPNPGNGEFSFQGNFPPLSRIEFCDLLGNKLSEIEVPAGDQNIPISLPFAEGAYLFRVISDTDVLKTGKLVIQK